MPSDFPNDDDPKQRKNQINLNNIHHFLVLNPHMINFLVCVCETFVQQKKS